MTKEAFGHRFLTERGLVSKFREGVLGVRCITLLRAMIPRYWPRK